MKKDLTELVFILDRSGSMQGLEEDTIGGFNSMLEKQKRETGEAFVSTILFDDWAEVLHDRIPIREVSPITGRDYWVRGCTALLDALAGPSSTSRTSTSTPGARTSRSTRCSSSPLTAWRMPAAAIPCTKYRR